MLRINIGGMQLEFLKATTSRDYVLPVMFFYVGMRPVCWLVEP